MKRSLLCLMGLPGSEFALPTRGIMQILSRPTRRDCANAWQRNTRSQVKQGEVCPLSKTRTVSHLLAPPCILLGKSGVNCYQVVKQVDEV